MCFELATRVFSRLTVNQANPLARPTVELFNSREKIPLRILRGDQTVAINPVSSGELQDGDIVYLGAGNNVAIR